MGNDRWISVTTLGSEWDHEMTAGGLYHRHRPFSHGGPTQEWRPGPPPKPKEFSTREFVGGERFAAPASEKRMTEELLAMALYRDGVGAGRDVRPWFHVANCVRAKYRGIASGRVPLGTTDEEDQT